MKFLFSFLLRSAPPRPHVFVYVFFLCCLFIFIVLIKRWKFLENCFSLLVHLLLRQLGKVALGLLHHLEQKLASHTRQIVLNRIFASIFFQIYPWMLYNCVWRAFFCWIWCTSWKPSSCLATSLYDSFDLSFSIVFNNKVYLS